MVNGNALSEGLRHDGDIDIRRGNSLSMAISPDLDALLEFDDKMRRARHAPARCKKPRSAPGNISPGLPPPPRLWNHAQGSHSTMTVKELSLMGRVSEENVTVNPYINSPPSLHAKQQPATSDPLLARERETTDLHTRNGKGGTRREDLENRQQPCGSSGKSGKDKLLGLGKMPFGLGLLNLMGGDWKVSERTRKPPRYGKKTPRKTAGGRSDDSNQLEMVDELRERQTDDGYDSHWQPNASHDRWHTRCWSDSTSSLVSSCCNSTLTDASSDFDCHISISSTIYPPSSAPSFDMHISSVRFPPAFPARDSREKLSDSDSAHSFPNSTSSLPLCPIVSPKLSPVAGTRWAQPTINLLDHDQRSDLIRKNKKLIRLLGQSPGPDALSHQDPGRRHKRATTSYLTEHRDILPTSLPVLHASQQSTDTLSGTPDVFGDDPAPDPDEAEGTFSITDGDNWISASAAVVSLSPPSSYIKLSDDLGSATPKSAGDSRPCSPSISILASLTAFDDLSAEEQAEELRRRKREKLARLHRFLGFQVPVNLALGLNDDIEDSLPPVQAQPDLMPSSEVKKATFRRRRCSSADPPYTSLRFDNGDRMKEDLNVREKALNVRRAQKMEKVFGVAPPQTLYHTRHQSSQSQVVTHNHPMSHSVTDPGPKPQPPPGWTFLNKVECIATTTGTTTTKEAGRPPSSDSQSSLLPKPNVDTNSGVSQTQRRPSIVYSNYQESLNSLSDIMERDDKESLAELCEYLNSGNMNVPPPSPTFQNFTRTASGDRRASNASSVTSERRLSLPTSISSFSSDLSAASPHPEVSGFQIRRRRAAKLSQFFGVNYRELITDAFESIEHGVENEHRRGTLNQDEAQDLLACLRKLKSKGPAT